MLGEFLGQGEGGSHVESGKGVVSSSLVSRHI